MSINGAGNRVAIGAPFNDNRGSDAGHVRVYEFNGAIWTQLGLDINGESAGDNFGSSVSINNDGNRVAIGAPNNAGTSTDAGHVRVYEFNGSDWIQIANDIEGESQDDKSGSSVSINDDGTRVAIGAPYNAGAGLISGHVRVYDFNGAIWSQLGLDIDGNSIFDAFGQSVSIDSVGNRVVIGAPKSAAGLGPGTGLVRIYEFDGTDWIQLGADLNG